MKKRYVLLKIFVLIISLFLFSNNVFASSAFSCYYSCGDNIATKHAGFCPPGKNFVLVQKSDGSRSLYASTQIMAQRGNGVYFNEETNSNGSWKSVDVSVSIEKVSTEKLDEEGNLKDCPRYISIKKEKYNLLDEKGWSDATFYDFYDKQIEEEVPKNTIDNAGEIINPAGPGTDTDADDVNDVDLTSDIIFSPNTFKVCTNNQFLGDAKLSELLHSLVNIVKVIIPIILLVFGSLDFAQAIFAQDEGSIKKAQSKFIKRLIIAVVIFLIPSMMKTVLGLAKNIWPVIDADLCGIL